MIDADKPRFFALIALTAEAYDVPALSKARLALLYDDLSEYDIAAIADALTAHRRACKWFPKVSEIIERLQPAVDQRAALAWADVQVQLRNSRSARSDDPITEAVVRQLGGWTALGQVPADKLVWSAKDFERRYQILAQHDPDALAALTGPRSTVRVLEVAR